MTTVAVDRQNKIMAADFMIVDEGRKVGGGPKITRQTHKGKNILMATAGDMRVAQEFETWFLSSRKAPFKGKTVYALILYEDGTLLTYDNHTLYEVKDRFFTIGSGGDYALGALYAGVSVDEAVNIAGLLDSSTGFGVQCERFEV